MKHNTSIACDLFIDRSESPAHWKEPMYSLHDLEEARAELAKWQRRDENYTGNNPNKYQASIKASRRMVRLISEALKASGTLERTDKEELEIELNAAFPNAQSKEIVDFQGRRFQRRFYPLEQSRSRKTVTDWGREWVEL